MRFEAQHGFARGVKDELEQPGNGIQHCEIKCTCAGMARILLKLPQHPCRGACRAGFARAWGHRLNVRQDGLPGIGLSFPGRGCVRDPGLGDAMRAQKLMERRVGVFQRVEQGGGAAL